MLPCKRLGLFLRFGRYERNGDSDSSKPHPETQFYVCCGATFARLDHSLMLTFRFFQTLKIWESVTASALIFTFLCRALFRFLFDTC